MMNRLLYFQEMESLSRRSDALHPDVCDKLHIRGVQWAIPPRGLKISPVFHGDSVSVTCRMDDWPEATQLLELARVTEDRFCLRCGQARRVSLEISQQDTQFLARLYELAAQLLGRQYELTQQQLVELLSFERQVPAWVGQLLQWCGGLGTEQSDDQGSHRNVEQKWGETWEVMRVCIENCRRFVQWLWKLLPGGLRKLLPCRSC